MTDTENGGAQIAPLLITIPGFTPLFNFNRNLPNLGTNNTRGITIHVTNKLHTEDFE